MNNLAYLLKKVSVKFKFQVRGCLCRGGSRHFFMSFSSRLFLLTFVETIKIRNMTETIITAVVTAFCTGGLTWLFTLRYTRKQAEADAMKSVQEVYQKLIEDLKSDRQDLKKRFDELDNKYKEVLHKCNEMEKAIRQNSRVMDTMKPFLCGVKGCLQRKSITFDYNN